MFFVACRDFRVVDAEKVEAHRVAHDDGAFDVGFFLRSRSEVDGVSLTIDGCEGMIAKAMRGC